MFMRKMIDYNFNFRQTEYTYKKVTDYHPQYNNFIKMASFQDLGVIIINEMMSSL